MSRYGWPNKRTPHRKHKRRRKPVTDILPLNSKHITKTSLFKYTEISTTKKWKFSGKKSDIFHISAQNIDSGYSLEPPRWGGSNAYPQSMVLSRNRKNNVFPSKPQFRLGKRELILVLFVRLFDLCLFGFVGFLFLLGSGKGCVLWLWHSLDFSPTFFYYIEVGLKVNIILACFRDEYNLRNRFIVWTLSFFQMLCRTYLHNSLL